MQKIYQQKKYSPVYKTEIENRKISFKKISSNKLGDVMYKNKCPLFEWGKRHIPEILA